ncbi:MAG TPA: polyprenyl synthetase family protein [Nocardioidaceae bacterium]|nr:polyprenyl synthetase family protein [Nocardioidaceae bacterium]
MPPLDPTAARPSWDDAAFRESIQTTLDTFVDEQARTLEPLGPDARRLVEAAHRSVSGGKRFRAAFCYWGFNAVDGGTTDEAALVKASAALELLHASALVHDDYMDDSDTRRGRPATHKSFERHHREHGWSGDPEQYGAAAAILLGDLLLSWSDEMLRTCGIADSAVRDALGFFDATRSEVIAGQFLDVSVQARGESDVDVAMRVLRYKSAKYSIERPLHIGAALAGGGPEVLAALSGFGLPLGEAFQLRDDLLGVFGDPAVTGKPAGDDLTEGKRTVLIALALARAPHEQAALLDARLGTDLSPEDVRVLQQVIEDSGAPTEVEKMIGELTDRSLTALEQAPITAGARTVLHSLAMAATQRVV